MIELDEKTSTERWDPEYLCPKCEHNPRGDGPCPRSLEEGDDSPCDCCGECAEDCAADI